MTYDGHWKSIGRWVRDEYLAFCIGYNVPKLLKYLAFCIGYNVPNLFSNTHKKCIALKEHGTLQAYVT